jgi:hypothetical protein
MNPIESINHKAIETINAAKKKQNRVTLFRFLVFIFFVVELGRFTLLKTSVLELIIGILFFLIFFSLVITSKNLSETIQFFDAVKKVCFEIQDEGKSNVGKSYHEVNSNHPYGHDLGIFGNNSLFQKINRCQTIFGKNKLAFYLANPLLIKEAILERQKGIKELSQKVKWCVDFLATTKAIDQTDSNLKKERNWTFDYTDFRLNKKSLRLFLIFVPIINLALIIVAILLKSTLFITLVFLFLVLLSLIVNKIYGKTIHEIIAAVDTKTNELKGYVPVLLLIEQEKFLSENTIQLQKKIATNSETTASVLIHKLSKLIDSYDSGTIQIFGTILDMVFLWRLQYATKIENFIFENNTEFPKWFDAIAEFEALISLGLFAYKNDEFQYPICSETPAVINATNLSHPLIPKKDRVYNDFSTIENNNVTIVTGANMTGKSTFLRSVGINLVLAMNGCPVCAASFVFSPISIFTSMSTSDSLSDGSSYFNAEIQRLRLLIEKLEKKEPQFIILDEILKGTNSVDKLKGSELFLEKIIKMKTFNTCLIATHDLELTKMESSFPTAISNYCFELHNRDGKLEPDYKLQSGVTKSMNAIELMRSNHII